MTFDEIQKTIEGMLAVQRNLQESQLKHEEVLSRLEQNQLKHEENLTRVENNLEKNFTQLQSIIGELAQIALASDKALLERIEAVEEKINPEKN